MIKLQDLENTFGIKVDKKLGRNFQYKINIHKVKEGEEVSKFNLRHIVMCPTSLDYKRAYEDYKMGSRIENFLMCVLDCLLFETINDNLNVEKREIYRKYLAEKITLEDIKKYDFKSVTH